MDTLPNELLVQILVEADPATVRQISRSCRRLHSLSVAFRAKMKKGEETNVLLIFEGNSTTFHWNKQSEVVYKYVDDYVLTKNAKTYRTRKDLSADDLKKTFEAFEQYYSIRSLNINGLLDDSNLKTLLQCIRCRCEILGIGNSHVTFTDLQLWSKFLSKMRPKKLSFEYCLMIAPHTFAQNVLQEGFRNRMEISVVETSFHQKLSNCELNSLPPFPLEELTVRKRGVLDVVCLIIQRWLQEEHELEYLFVEFDNDDRGCIIAFLEKFSEHEFYNSDDFSSTVLTNKHGYKCAVGVLDTELVIFPRGKE